MLGHALAWAARGFRIFPVDANTRGGPGHFPLGAGWPDYASNDPAVIRGWWSVYTDANIACLTTGLVVCDVDVKRGKAGLTSMHALGIDDFETLTIRTTTGGFHAYYQGLDDQLVGSHPIADGIDIRSYHAYVLAPGSVIDGKPYEVEIDLPPAPVPENIVKLLHEPRKRPEKANGHATYTDSNIAIQLAQAFLAERLHAVEGQNGDDWTYKTIAVLRDIGLSPEMALELLWPWNLRCAPPWSIEELTAKVGNVYRYATGFVGSANPETHYAFTRIEPVPPSPSPFAGHTGVLRRVGPRPWIYKGLLLSSLITTLIGPGGVGKSVFMLALAAHLACGQSFLGYECLIREGASSIIYNGEDDRDEMDRRLEAICSAYGLSEETVARHVIMLSEADFPPEKPLLLAGYDATRRLITGGESLAHVINTARDRKVRLIGLDPLVELHDGDENNNGEMRYVMKCARAVAKRTGASVMLGHHTSQTAQLNKQVAGNMYAARGATSIVNASRVALTLSAPSEEDCRPYGIDAKKRRDYVRLDDAKQQFQRISDQAQWLRWKEVQTHGGDVVGIPVGDPTPGLTAASMAQEAAFTLIAGMTAAGARAWPAAIAERYLQEQRVNYTEVEKLFDTPVYLTDGSGLELKKEGKRWNVVRI